MKSNVEQEFNLFGKRFVKQARTVLTKKGKNTTKDLYNSIGYKFKKSKNSVEISFSMQDYGKFQDLGVRGKTSSKKAPQSPFGFGSGKGKKGGLTDGINRWVKKRGFQFRDKAGRFMSYDSTAFLITRSIYQKGIKPTGFFTRPFELAFKKLPDDIVTAYGLDLDRLLKTALK